MANTTTQFEDEINAGSYSLRDRALMGGASYRLRQSYYRGIADPAAHNIALANPEYVDALARNNKTASFALITIQ